MIVDLWINLLLTNWYRILSAIYPTHIKSSSFINHRVQTFVSLSLTTYNFLFSVQKFKVSFFVNFVYQTFFVLHYANLFNQSFYFIKLFCLY